MSSPVRRLLQAVARRRPTAEPPGAARLVALGLLVVAVLLVVTVGLLDQTAQTARTAQPGQIAASAAPEEPLAEGDGDLAGAGASPCPAPPHGPASTLLAAAGPEAAATVDRHEHEAPGALADLPASAPQSTSAPARTPSMIRWEQTPAVAAWTIEEDTAPPLALSCPPASAGRWHLAGFDTTLGSDAELHLANPNPSDAVARVTLLTPDGASEPTRTEDLVVEAGSQRVVDLVEVEPGLEKLAVAVEVREGRLVTYGIATLGPPEARAGADELLEDDDIDELAPPDDEEGLASPDDDVEGTTVVHPVRGQEGAAQPLVAARAPQGEDARSWLVVANPGAEPASFVLEATNPIEGGSTLGEHTLSAGATARFDLDGVSAGSDAGLVVRPREDAELIATRLTATAPAPAAGDADDADDADDAEGTGDLVAEPLRPAGTDWAVASPVADARHLHVANLGAEPTAVNVTVAGEAVEGWQERELPAGARADLALDEHARGPAAVRVTSADPVAATVVAADQAPLRQRVLPLVDLGAFRAEPAPAHRDRGLPAGPDAAHDP